MSSKTQQNQTSTYPIQTQYQVYNLELDNNHIKDFTSKKLMRYAMSVGSLEAHKVEVLLKDYIERKVAVCWRAGKPLYLLVTK